VPSADSWLAGDILAPGEVDEPVGDDDTPAPGPAKAIAVVHSEKCLCTGRLIDVEGTPSVMLTRSPAGAVGVAVGERFEYHGYDTGKRTRFAWAAWRVSSWGLRG